LLRPGLDRAFKKALATMSADQIRAGEWLKTARSKPLRNSKGGSQKATNLSPRVAHTTAQPLVKAGLALEDLDCDVKLAPPPKTKLPKAHKAPSRMDQDVANRKVDSLYDLVKGYHEYYILDRIDADCNQPSKQALAKERKVFYQLFGVTPNEKDCLASYIARDIGFSSPEPTVVINGLIKYFENLARFIGYKKTNLEKKAPALLKRYIRYAVHEVYGLINSISKKITTPNLQEVKNEELFPMVSKFITNALGPLKPVEF
jgi:hypothetical protein